MAGKVYVGEKRVDKPGQKLDTEVELIVRGKDNPYVSRGGLKLHGALEALDFDPEGKVVADFGASTGGFTDCVLQKGAVKVYAIDVGYGQLHASLREHPQVVNMERTNARHLDSESLPEPVDLVVIDASFISLTKLMPAVSAVLHAERGDVLAMVKPQFEVGKENVGRGGVVRDDELRRGAADRVAGSAATFDLIEVGRADSKVHGPKGNREIFLWLQRRPSADVESE